MKKITIQSIYVGKCKLIGERGNRTGMYKEAVSKPVRLSKRGLLNDFIGDKTIHGGVTKALHHFPSEHYATLSQNFPLLKPIFCPGSIGENMSSTGVTERNIHLGDIFSLGSAKVQLSEPRKPCWKIDARYAQQGIAAFMFTNGISGWYYCVVEEGEISPGDELKLEHRVEKNPSLLEYQEVITALRPNPMTLREFSQIDSLPKDVARRLIERAEWLSRNSQSK